MRDILGDIWGKFVRYLEGAFLEPSGDVMGTISGTFRGHFKKIRGWIGNGDTPSIYQVILAILLICLIIDVQWPGFGQQSVSCLIG